MEMVFENNRFRLNSDNIPTESLKDLISRALGLAPDQYYIISNGRKVTEANLSGTFYVIPRLLGGKGGFGSMLRAIGAQIEKTTNREACRDLSGRRLRDINEEQRLKKWVTQQAEREKEAKEKKKKKLEKLLEQPKHDFKDEEYDKERSELPERVEDAVLKGLEASCSSTKRKSDGPSAIPRKKPKLWLDAELDEDISSSESDIEETCEKTKLSELETDAAEENESKRRVC